MLLTSRDRESGAHLSELAGSEEFLASHVLRLPGRGAPSTGPKEAGPVRDGRGKAKQYTTINGRTVVIKDAFVYSDKGEEGGSQGKKARRRSLTDREDPQASSTSTPRSS